MNATVTSSDDGGCDDQWAFQVFVPALAAQWQASMHKGPNNVFNPQRKVRRIAGSRIVNGLAGDGDGRGGRDDLL